MLHALVDLGSNSIRLSVYKYRDNKIIPLINKKEMVGLAGYVINGSLTEAGIRNAITVLAGYKEIIKNFGIPHMHVFATASLRNINNTQDVLERIRQATTINVDVLSGVEEARLDFVGATYFLKKNRGILVDIGGGSTELVVFEGNTIQKLTSIPIGSLNLYVNNVKKILPDTSERKKIKKRIDEQLDSLNWKKLGSSYELCGIGGTVRGCFRICQELFYENKDMKFITPSDIKKVVNLLEQKDLTSFKDIYRIVPERIFTITPGIMILNETIKRFKPETITLSKTGLREGYLIDQILKVGI